MTELELERQLLTAFRALSRQYKMEQQRHCEEQRRHCEQVEALQQRVEQQAAENKTLRRLVEHFGGQVTRLTADLRTLAETLRGPWN